MTPFSRTAAILASLLVSLVNSTESFGQSQTIRLEFQESTEPFANPMKGWVAWGEDFIEHPPQPLSLIFSYRSWRELEPVEGRFEFESWENDVWKPWTDQGKKVIFRVYVDYPGRPTGMPQWLLDAGVGGTEYDEYGGGFSPDYKNPLFLEKVKILIQKLGERYDRDPRVAFLDVGVLGHWGEWHTYPREELFASPTVQRGVMEAFLAAFTNKKMMLRYPTGWTAQRPFGYRDDCFLTDTDGPEDWYFFQRIQAARANEVWKTQPIGGEFCGGGRGAHEGTLEQPEECLRLIREGHFSHLGPAGGTIAAEHMEHQTNLNAMLDAMGYRFVLRSAELPQPLVPGELHTITLELENTGSAPFYYPWTLWLVWLDERNLELARSDSGIAIDRWWPGTERLVIPIQLPDEVEIKTIRLGIHIPDPDGQGIPLRFANQGATLPDGTFVLGSFSIDAVTDISPWEPYR